MHYTAVTERPKPVVEEEVEFNSHHGEVIYTMFMIILVEANKNILLLAKYKLQRCHFVSKIKSTQWLVTVSSILEFYMLKYIQIGLE